MTARCRGEDGTIAVEVAIALPVIFLFLMALFDFGYLELRQSQLTSASHDGARIGLVHWQDADMGSYSGGTCPAVSSSTSTSFNKICTGVLSRLAGSTVSSIVVQCLDRNLAPKNGTGNCDPSTVSHGLDFIQVTVSYPYLPSTIVGRTVLGASHTYTASTQMVIP